MTGKAVNTPRVKEVPITELVIKAVEKLAEKDGIKCLKITDRNDGVLVTADNIAGVDFRDELVNEDDVEEDDPPSDEEDDDDGEYVDEVADEDDEVEDEDLYDRIDPAELEDLLEEDEEDDDPRPNVANSGPSNQVAERHGDGARVTDSDGSTMSSGLRRSTRVSRPVERYQAHQKRVTFAADPAIMMEKEEV